MLPKVTASNAGTPKRSVLGELQTRDGENSLNSSPRFPSSPSSYFTSFVSCSFPSFFSFLSS